MIMNIILTSWQSELQKLNILKVNKFTSIKSNQKNSETQSIKCELSFRNVRISSDFSILFLRPAVKRPQTEKIRSTYAWLAGAATKSSASGASIG